MSATKPYIRQMHFSGGVNNSLSDELIADNEVAAANNYIPNPRGQGNLIKRPGYALNVEGRAAVTSVDVTSIYVGKLANYYTDFATDLTPKSSICSLADGTELYAGATDIAGGPLWETFNSYDVCSWIAGTLLKTTNGTSFAAVAGFPATGSGICEYNNMLFTLLTDGSTISYSAIGDETSWPATNTITFVGKTRGDILTALAKFRDYLVVFSYRSRFLIQGYSATDLSVIHTNRSSGAHQWQSVVSCPYGLFWWDSKYGVVRSVDGIAVDFPMVRKQSATLRAFNAQPGVEPSIPIGIYVASRKCVSYYIATAGVAPTVRCDYYPETDSWWQSDSGIGAVSAAFAAQTTYTQRNDTSTIYLGAYAGANANTYAEGDALAADQSVAYTAYIKTKRYAEQSVATIKGSRNVFLTTKMASQGALTYGYYQDNATTLSQTYTPTVATGVVDTIVGINNSNRKIQHYISDANNARNELISMTESGVIADIT